jgi:plastocyanin
MRRPPLPVAVLLAAALLGGAGCRPGAGDQPADSAPATSAVSHDHGAAAPSAPVAPVGGVLGIRVDELGSRATEFLWKPDNLLLTSGRTVTLRIANADYMQHNFTFKAAKVAKNLPVGATTTIRFVAPGPGTYQFYCKYHLQMMDGAVTVR